MKYSIIIPTYNSLEYLKDCIFSVVEQDFQDYELIVSDNMSTDGTYEYVASLQHPNIKLIQPKEHLIMADHWEFAIAKAKGEWVTIVGSDDGLMPYFFSLAETLTAKAQQKGIEVIGSERAYFFWEGCQNVYGDVSYSYSAQNIYTIRNSYERLLKTLLCEKEAYFSLPHMYTSSIVHRNVLQRIRKKQNFQLIKSVNPDCSLACEIMLETHVFLHSFIPLGIVGSSPSSNGLKYYSNSKDAERNFYSKNISWNLAMGKVENRVNSARYFLFEAVLNSTLSKHHEIVYSFLQSKVLKELVFSCIKSDLLSSTRSETDKSLEHLDEIIAYNNISQNTIDSMRNNLSSVIAFILHNLSHSEHLHSYNIMKGEQFNSSQMSVSHSCTDCYRLFDMWNKVKNAFLASNVE